MAAAIYHTGDVARELGISSNWVRELVRRRELVSQVSPSGVHVFKATDVRRLKLRREREGKRVRSNGK